METDSLPDILRILAYVALAFAGIAGPLIFLRERQRQGGPRSPRHTDTEPGPSSRH